MSEYQEFVQWLQDHNWCKATPCINCYYWGTFEERNSNDKEFTVIRTCRQWKTKTYSDDYCSRHLMRIKKKGD